MINPSKNSSYQTLVYLKETFSSELPLIEHIWKAFCNIMAESNKQGFYREDRWEQDWWLAKFARTDDGVGITSEYRPPDHFFAFPSFDVEARIARMAQNPVFRIWKNEARFDWAGIFTAGGPEPDEISAPYTYDEFLNLGGSIRKHGDTAMIQHNQVLAWVELAMGSLFTGILLTPIGDNFQDLWAACEKRWSDLWEERDIYEEYLKTPELIQWKLDVFYGAKMTENGLLMKPSRQGQPERWREFWNWLSVDLSWEQALASVRIAAGLLSPPLVSLFLQQIFRTAAESLTTEHLLAVAIFRRWLLTLEVMAWLEEALQYKKWRTIRPLDLMTFAYTALRPHWPRRVLGISHRSIDAKPFLQEMNLWEHFSYAIDATFVPQWETNIAMVWGLFSATPGLVRVKSERYEQSIWCLREHELFDYLARENDFLDRYVIDLDLTDVRHLDSLLPDFKRSHTPMASTYPPGKFPLLSTVFVLYPFEEWENKLLACVAAFRFIYLAFGNPVLTNEVCLKLAEGYAPSGVPFLTNHPEGWIPWVKLFRKFQTKWADRPDQFSLQVEAGYFQRAEGLSLDQAWTNRVADLSSGRHRLEDVLAAFEWNRTLRKRMVGNTRYGDFIVIDFRDVSPESWGSEDRFMVSRGMSCLLLESPVWYLQEKGQDVEAWTGLGSNPIFTQHTPQQWNWMWKLMLEPTWPATFEQDSGLRFSKKLSQHCVAAGQRDGSYYAGKIRLDE